MSGYVIVGGEAYENSYVPEGKAIRIAPTCPLCRDTGRQLTDDGTEGEFCDCRSGMAQYENTEYEAGGFPAWSNGWWDR